MKRAWFIIFFGLCLAVVAYCGLYFARTAPDRDMLRSNAPELAWLKKEFNLTDAEYKRIVDLHAAYQPHCVEMCGRIAAKNAELKELLAKSNTITPEIEKKLAEAAELRAECQKSMLQHFYEVSKTMPPNEGKRYLAWVQERTLMSNEGMKDK